MYTYGYSTEARGKAPDEKLARRESARGGSAKRDGRGGEATVEDRERSAFGRGEEWRKRGGGQPAEKRE